MKITSIEAIPFNLPPRRDFKWAGLAGSLGRFVLIRVRTDQGLVGYGEATPQPDWGGDYGRRNGETQLSVVNTVKEALAPALFGCDPLDVIAASQRMDAAIKGNAYAKCAVDMALHDIAGKAAGLPLYKMLGGAVREDVPVAHMVGLMPEADALEEAAGAVADGIGAFQIKGGVDPERDIRLIAALRKQLGDGIKLRLDANQGYRHVKTAVRVVEALHDSGLNFIEQPVEGLGNMAEVTRQVHVPVIADESCWNAADALDLVAARAADCISIYLAKAGGFVGARRVAAIADAAGLRCDVNGSIESAIGNAANVHFALAMPCVTLPAVIPVSAPAGQNPCGIGGHYFEDDVITEAFPFAKGSLLPLDMPGLGLEIDEAKLKRYLAQ